MNRPIFVHLLPTLFEPEEVRGGIAVILDILRASTTIVHALAHGAAAVIPTLDVDEALAAARSLPTGTALTGGERDGLLIPGFDLDNNPFAYAPEVVSSKTVVFTTSNGTRALLRARAADRVLIGSFVNLQAVVRVLSEDSRPVHLVCAGTMGQITAEDALCAGAIACGVAAALGVAIDDIPNDPLQLVAKSYQQVAGTAESLHQALRSSFGGRNCRRLGFDRQIERAATRNMFDIVPEFAAASGRITI